MRALALCFLGFALRRGLGHGAGMEYILITGASSGIGEELAKQWAAKGKNLILAARRRDRLEHLAERCRGLGVAAEVVEVDLRESTSAQWLFDHVKEKGWVVEGLVNNAGLGWQETFAEQTAERVETMLAVNLLALTRLCHLFLPRFYSRKSGFILNIASTASVQAVPYFAVYAATKAYVVSLSEALHEESLAHGVLVTAVCPGPVSTEFKSVAGMSERFFATAQRVEPCASACIRAVEDGKALAWTAWSQRIFSLVSSLTPHWIRRKAAAALMRASMR